MADYYTQVCFEFELRDAGQVSEVLAWFSDINSYLTEESSVAPAETLRLQTECLDPLGLTWEDVDSMDLYAEPAGEPNKVILYSENATVSQIVTIVQAWLKYLVLPGPVGILFSGHSSPMKVDGINGGAVLVLPDATEDLNAMNWLHTHAWRFMRSNRRRRYRARRTARRHPQLHMLELPPEYSCQFTEVQEKLKAELNRLMGIPRELVRDQSQPTVRDLKRQSKITHLWHLRNPVLP